MLELLEAKQTRPYPPRVSAFTQTFSHALANGRLVTTECAHCARRTFPPKVHCPECWSSDVQWTEIPVGGTLYSWTRVHASPSVFKSEAPYAVGIVDLDAGIRLACRIVTSDEQPLTIALRVEMI